MTNQEKAELYDNLIRESDRLHRANSILKSEYVINMPREIQETLKENERKINFIVGRLEWLMSGT